MSIVVLIPLRVRCFAGENTQSPFGICEEANCQNKNLSKCFLPDSPTQAPEKLFHQRAFVIWAAVCVGVFVALLFIDLPEIGQIFVPTIRVRAN